MRFGNPLKESSFVKVDKQNRFYFMLQQMQSNRWRITSIVLFLFFFIIFGINVSVLFEIRIEENWKEMLLILLGAFVGNLNKVVDYWFNSEDRDKMLIQKVDEEDGSSASSVLEYQSSRKKPEVFDVVPVSAPVDRPIFNSESEIETSVETPIDEPTEYPSSDLPSDDEESDIK
jgi:hypothetical protein